MTENKKRRNKITKKKNMYLMISVFVFLLGLAFYINFKTESKKNVAINNNKKTIQTLPNHISNVNKNLEEISPRYQKLNNDYSDTDVYKPDGHKIAYLTFDDGPTADITPKILDILKAKNIKATFFVIGKNIIINKDLLLREKAEGHSIGNHTYSHDPVFLYNKPQNLVSDFKKNENTIKQFIPDYNSNIVRFPGGSKNRSKQFRDAVTAAGYRYFDWDCLTRDAEINNISVIEEDRNVKSTFRNQKNLIILMHDSTGNNAAVQYLPLLINFLKTNGYIFNPIN